MPNALRASRLEQAGMMAVASSEAEDGPTTGQVQAGRVSGEETAGVVRPTTGEAAQGGRVTAAVAEEATAADGDRPIPLLPATAEAITRPASFS